MTDKKELYKLLAKSKKEDPEGVSVTIFEDGSVENSAPNPARAETVKKYVEENIQGHPEMGLRGGYSEEVDGEKRFVTTMSKIKFGEPKYDVAFAESLRFKPLIFDSEELYLFAG